VRPVPGTAARGQAPSLPARAVLGVLQVYRRALSPFLPPGCRYWPSCSEYAQEAIRRRGLVRGALLAVGRVLRCSPLSAGGVDLPR
jgi:putative membrane protein insertion efficiency factor